MSAFTQILEEDSDFSLNPKSNLGNVFGSSGGTGDANLTYQRPLEPQAQAQPQGDAEPASLQFAVAANVFHYANGQYESKGKLGVAVVGYDKKQDYKLIIYNSTKQQIASATIYDKFKFTPQAGNYATFYDDSQQNWSINFDSAANAIDFAKNVGLGIFNKGKTELVMQDQVLGDGDSDVRTGDSVEVRYTGYLVKENGAIGEEFDSNLKADKAFKFKLGKGKVIQGWEKGVVGMKKGGKRVIVVPPALGYGASGVPGKIPANSALLFQIEIVKHKSKDGKMEVVDTTAETKSATSDPAPTELGSEADEASAKKAALLERMSKMGRGVMGDEAQDPNMQQQGFGQPGQPNMQNPMGNQMGMNPQMGQFQQQGQFQNQNGFPNQQPMFNQFGQQIMPQNRPQNQLALMPQMQQQQQNQQQMFDQFGNPIPSPQQQQQQQQEKQQKEQILTELYRNKIEKPLFIDEENNKEQTIKKEHNTTEEHKEVNHKFTFPEGCQLSCIVLNNEYPTTTTTKWKSTCSTHASSESTRCKL
eukprot:m.149827 g.149827  ORF g.149827 m.149827 type:complete len:531 (-) comp15019_c3_seq2:1763-3355(-)